MTDEAQVEAEGKTFGQKVMTGCGVLIAIFVGLMILGSIVGEPPESDESAKALADAVAADANAAIEADDASPVAEATEAGGDWSYAEQQDELRGKTDYYAEVRSENAADFDFPYGSGNHLTMTVRKSSAFGQDVYFHIDNGQMICGIYDCKGMISFDGKAEALTLVPPEDHDSKTLFAKFDEGIIKKLKTADRVIVEIQFYQEGNRQFKFNTKGLKWQH